VASLFFTPTSYCAPVSDATDGGLHDERWLSDESFYDFGHEDETPQADGREIAANDLCPPVPRKLPVSGCEVEPCSSDRECVDRHLKCCYNGCVYTCLPEVKPPAYLDWMKEPVRRLQFGQSWLVPGPNLQRDELCSTGGPASDDSDPLLCPHGYECSIDDVGRPAEGIPNRGHCVKVVDDSTPGLRDLGSRSNYAETTLVDSEDSSQEDTASMHACRLEEEGKMILSGHSVRLDGSTCVCQETRLKCEDISPSLTL
jgi:hypothetical protein